MCVAHFPWASLGWNGGWSWCLKWVPIVNYATNTFLLLPVAAAPSPAGLSSLCLRVSGDVLNVIRKKLLEYSYHIGGPNKLKWFCVLWCLPWPKIVDVSHEEGWRTPFPPYVSPLFPRHRSSVTLGLVLGFVVKICLPTFVYSSLSKEAVFRVSSLWGSLRCWYWVQLTSLPLP